MTFNELQRELIKRKIDPNVGFVVSMLYERMIEQQKQLDETLKLVDAMASSLAGFVELREHDQDVLKRLMRDSHTDGVEVKSVVNEPEDDR